MTALGVRSVATLSDAELRQSAWGRVSATAARYGADARQTREALARWAQIDAARTAGDDLLALAEAVGIAPTLLRNAAAERAHRAGGA